MNFASQADMVRGSLLMDEQRQHRHDAPARRQLVRDTNAQPLPRGGERVGSRVYAPGGEEAGCDGCPPAPTIPARVGRECSKCKGTGELRYNPTPWGLPVDPQLEAVYECLQCSGTGTVPVPRRVPNTQRVM